MVGGPKSKSRGLKKKVAKVEIYVIFLGFLLSVAGGEPADFKDAFST